jgi:ATP-dependent DNA helicase RecG
MGKGENEKVEFKENFDKEAIETAVAFANANGGTILMGVDNSGKIKGTSIGKETLKDWVNEISQATQPTLIPEIKSYKIKGKTIVAITIEKSPIKPIAYKSICYARVGNSNKKLSPKEIAELHLQTIGSSWDGYLTKEAALEDIDSEKVKEYIKLANETGRRKIKEKPLEVLKKLDLTKDNKPTWAAILLFGKEPQRFVSQAKIHCGRFKGETTIIDDELIEGTIIEQVDKTLEFIKKHLKLRFEISGEARRREEWEYPLPAVRESVINAVCHRDYTEPSDIQVRIYDDELIVWSPGKLPLGITLEELCKPHKSVLRNKLIAQVFFDIALIERWGTGINRMIDACRAQGLPEPKFEEYQGFRVMFRKPFAKEELTKIGLNERQLKAVEYTEKNGSITNREYQKLNNTTKRTATRDLTDLVQRGIFRSIGKGKRKLRYTLTLKQNVPKMSQKMSQKPKGVVN